MELAKVFSDQEFLFVDVACPDRTYDDSDSLAEYAHEEQAKAVQKCSDEVRIGDDVSENYDRVAIVSPDMSHSKACFTFEILIMRIVFGNTEPEHVKPRYLVSKIAASFGESFEALMSIRIISGLLAT